jgi:hypothetical protein
MVKISSKLVEADANYELTQVLNGKTQVLAGTALIQNGFSCLLPAEGSEVFMLKKLP